MSMKRSQLIVAIVAGCATAFGVALATIQLKTKAPETSNSNNTAQAARSQPLPAPMTSVLATPPIDTSVDANYEVAKTTSIIVTPPQEGCQISMAIVADPNPPLNVRSTPKVTPGNIVGKLNNGTFVSVVEQKNDWLRISEPNGWISKSLTQSSCANVNKRINFPPGGNSAIVRGRIIGGGTHSYTLKAVRGQTMTIKAREGPIPFIFAPNDPNRRADLIRGKNWSGTLSVSGDYLIELNSNFRGFVYDFSIEVK